MCSFTLGVHLADRTSLIALVHDNLRVRVTGEYTLVDTLVQVGSNLKHHPCHHVIRKIILYIYDSSLYPNNNTVYRSHQGFQILVLLGVRIHGVLIV